MTFNPVLHSGGHSFQPFPVRNLLGYDSLGRPIRSSERLVTRSGLRLEQCSRCFAIIPEWAWLEGLWLLFSPATCRGDLHHGRRGTRTLTVSTGPGLAELPEPDRQLTLETPRA